MTSTQPSFSVSNKTAQPFLNPSSKDSFLRREQKEPENLFIGVQTVSQNQAFTSNQTIGIGQNLPTHTCENSSLTPEFTSQPPTENPRKSKSRRPPPSPSLAKELAEFSDALQKALQISEDFDREERAQFRNELANQQETSQDLTNQLSLNASSGIGVSPAACSAMTTSAGYIQASASERGMETHNQVTWNENQDRLGYEADSLENSLVSPNFAACPFTEPSPSLFISGNQFASNENSFPNQNYTNYFSQTIPNHSNIPVRIENTCAPLRPASLSRTVNEFPPSNAGESKITQSKRENSVGVGNMKYLNYRSEQQKTVSHRSRSRGSRSASVGPARSRIPVPVSVPVAKASLAGAARCDLNAFALGSQVLLAGDTSFNHLSHPGAGVGAVTRTASLSAINHLPHSLVFIFRFHFHFLSYSRIFHSFIIFWHIFFLSFDL